MKLFRRASAVVILVLAAGFAYFVEPHIAISEVHATSREETIQAMWILSCGEEFLSERDAGEDSRLDLVLPERALSPERSPAAIKDNVFVISGYRYKRIRTNRFTGA